MLVAIWDRPSAPHAPVRSDAYRRGIDSACFAAHAGLYLRPDGFVLPCCASARPVGTVTGPRREPLLDIWRGHRQAEVRRALERSDFGFGCDGCAIAAGDEVAAAASFARAYDRYATDEPDPAWPRHLDLALSSNCNLQCVMCNGDLSSSIRTGREGRPPLPPAYDEAFFAELRELLPHLETIHFKGGEPFLSTEAQRVWDDLLELETTCAVTVTTNGTHLTERGAAYVRDLRMQVLVSIDAIDPAAYRAIRVGAEVDRVLANLDRLQELTADAGASTSLVMCLMAGNADQVAPILQEADRRDLSVSVIWVDSPSRFDLRRAGTEVIAEARRVLEAADDELRSTLGPQRLAVWQDVLDGVRALDASGPAAAPAVAVSIGAAPGTGPIDELERSLRDEVEGPLLEATATDGIWRRVDAPGWAGPLDPASWIGRSLADTLAMIWEATGAAVRYDTDVRVDGVRTARLEIDLASGPMALRAVIAPGDDGRSATLLLGVERS